MHAALPSHACVLLGGDKSPSTHHRRMRATHSWAGDAFLGRARRDGAARGPMPSDDKAAATSAEVLVNKHRAPPSPTRRKPYTSSEAQPTQRRQAPNLRHGG